MPPAKKQPAQRTVNVTVYQAPIPFNAETNTYNINIEVEDGAAVNVLDFAETWARESGILTVAVMNG